MASHDSKFLSGGRKTRKIGDLVASLDLGATKIACLIGRTIPPSEGGIELIGNGQQSCRGLKAGVVIDMDGLERSIRLAVEDAERMAEDQIKSVRLGLSGPYLTTKTVQTEIDMGGREIGRKDVQKLLETTLSSAKDEKQHILHALPLSYAIDGNDGVRDPRGMFADRLGVTMNIISMPMPVYRNIILCVSRAHLEVEMVAASGFASADCILTDDEKDNGAICLDLGGGSTSITVFMNGTLASLDVCGVGGQHVTSDLAHGICTTVPAAERIKTLHGTVMPSNSGPTEFIEAPKIGDDGRLQASRMPREELTGYITPRVEEIFEIVSKKLSASGLGGRLPRRVVLTGGGSELPGVRELASRVLAMPVRLGKPLNAEHLGEISQRASFSTSIGLLTFEQAGLSSGPTQNAVKSKDPSAERKSSVFGRAFDWFRENI